MEGCKTSNCSCNSAEKSNTNNNQDEAINASLKKIKQKFLVMSGKGGVGKTSTSVNIAISLSKMGFKVGLMDVDIHGPDIPRMLGLTGTMNLSENNKLIPMTYSDNLKVVSVEALIPDKDNAIIWRGPMKFAAIKQFLGDVEWGELDYLIIDSPPGTGDEPLTIAQIINDAKAIVVTTPQEIALADVRKSINFCKTVNMEIFGIIENMSGFKCPHCDEMISIFGSGGGEKTAIKTNTTFLGKIPFDLNMVTCGDSGIAFQDKYIDSSITKAFIEIASKMSK